MKCIHNFAYLYVYLCVGRFIVHYTMHTKIESNANIQFMTQKNGLNHAKYNIKDKNNLL